HRQRGIGVQDRAEQWMREPNLAVDHLDDSGLEGIRERWPAVVERPSVRDEELPTRGGERRYCEQHVSLTPRYGCEPVLHERAERRRDRELGAGVEVEAGGAQRAGLLEGVERVPPGDLVDAAEQRPRDRVAEVGLDQVLERRQPERPELDTRRALL